MVEFHCEGCGYHVIAVTKNTIPKHYYCEICLWMHKHVPDAEEFWKMYNYLRWKDNREVHKIG